MDLMESLCRLCGSEDGIKVDIFQQGTERARKIHKILPITVNEHDPFPKQICHHCSYKVDQFFEFRTTSIKTQEMLKKKVPWLKDKQLPQRCEGEQPMVEVALNSVYAISPNEKQVNPTNGYICESSDGAIVIEDSPPYFEHSDKTSSLVTENEVREENPTETRKSKKSRSRSMWDTKKRKKKSHKSCRIEEVFMTSVEEYQNIVSDPLRISTVDIIESNSVDNIDENNSGAVNSPKPDPGAVEKGILTDDRGGANIVLPKYILTTKIPRVGNVYTCERCGRTFLVPQPASQHQCPTIQAIPVEDDRPKEETQQHNEDVQTDTAKDFYYCSECGDVFTRHSQLVTHQKRHSSKAESSSDDSFKPFNSFKRRKHHTKRKHKQRLLNTSTIPNHNSSSGTTNHNHNSNSISIHHNHNSGTATTNHNHVASENNETEPNFYYSFDSMDTKITRHALLSSDSE